MGMEKILFSPSFSHLFSSPLFHSSLLLLPLFPFLPSCSIFCDQGPKVQQKTKEQKLAAALAGGRARKKKWNKGKTREKINAKVLFDEDTWTRFMTEVPKMKLVTPSALIERLKVNGSLARAALRYLEKEGKLTKIEGHHKQLIYTRNSA
jgi:small subunit ribosomal protein S25e